MRLRQLAIQAVRNLQDVSLDCHERFNVFFGDNGSGKTSVLEAIYILGLGRSFRHHLIEPVINHQALRLSVFCRGYDEQTIKQQLGIEKDRMGKTQIRFNGETVNSAAVLAEHLPLQMIHPDSDELITGGPKLRRQFLDWGTFHVEQSFFPLWKRLQKLLKQRNAALKMALPRDQVVVWDKEYVTLCEAVTQLRLNYLLALQPIFQTMINSLLSSLEVTLAYQQGWPQQLSLAETLERNFYRDAQLGYTYYGPQRDDMVVYCQQHPAAEVLSRGEQKLVIIALRLAQGKLLKEMAGRQCIYLLDDYAAELDLNHRVKVLEILRALDAQVFLSTINYEEVKAEFNFIEPCVFYVEHGRVKPV